MWSCFRYSPYSSNGSSPVTKQCPVMLPCLFSDCILVMLIFSHAVLALVWLFVDLRERSDRRVRLLNSCCILIIYRLPCRRTVDYELSLGDWHVTGAYSSYAVRLVSVPLELPPWISKSTVPVAHVVNGYPHFAFIFATMLYGLVCYT